MGAGGAERQLASIWLILSYSVILLMTYVRNCARLKKRDRECVKQKKDREREIRVRVYRYIYIYIEIYRYIEREWKEREWKERKWKQRERERKNGKREREV